MENYLKTLLESMTTDELVQRILEISSSAETLSKKVVNAEELVKSLEEELARVDKKHYADVQKLRERLEAKNGLIGTLKSQLDSAKNTIEALKSRNNDNNEITTDLELDNRRLQVRIQELEKQLKLAAEFGDACLDKVRDLEMKNGKLNENAKNYERKIDLQNESIHKLEERIVDLETKRDDFMHAYEHAREVIENQKATIQHIDKCRDELETKITESDGIRKAISEENDKLNRRTWELQRENLVLEHEIKNLKETKLGVINSFNINYLQRPYKTDYERTAEHIWNKYMALRKAGFDDDQAMCLIPMWDDEVDE